MSNWIYHSVLPSNNKQSFVEYDNVDFNLDFAGRSMLTNSVRITGSVAVTQLGQPLSAAANKQKDIKLDRLVGAHAFCESITTMVNGNIIENLTEYPRYVKMKNAGRKDINSMNNGSNVCELLAPTDEMTNLALKGTTPPDNDDGSGGDKTVPRNPDFSFKPEICLNNASGSPHVPYSKTGTIRVTVNLARTFAILFGLDVNSDTSYSISNLKLSFSSVPEEQMHMGEKTVMRTTLNLKQSIESSFTNVSVKVPAIFDRMSASFQQQDQENTALNNNTQLGKIEGLTETQFVWNDSTNSVVSYLLRDYEEVVSRYIESFYDTGKNVMTMNNLADNNGFGVGLNLDDFVDGSTAKFGLQLTSQVGLNQPSQIIYMYFHSIQSL